MKLNGIHQNQTNPIQINMTKWTKHKHKEIKMIKRHTNYNKLQNIIKWHSIGRQTQKWTEWSKYDTHKHKPINNKTNTIDIWNTNDTSKWQQKHVRGRIAKIWNINQIKNTPAQET